MDAVTLEDELAACKESQSFLAGLLLTLLVEERGICWAALAGALRSGGDTLETPGARGAIHGLADAIEQEPTPPSARPRLKLIRGGKDL